MASICSSIFCGQPAVAVATGTSRQTGRPLWRLSCARHQRDGTPAANPEEGGGGGVNIYGGDACEIIVLFAFVEGRQRCQATTDSCLPASTFLIYDPRLKGGRYFSNPASSSPFPLLVIFYFAHDSNKSLTISFQDKISLIPLRQPYKFRRGFVGNLTSSLVREMGF